MNRVLFGTQRQVMATFLAGLITILPLVITLAVIGWVANFIHGMVGPDTTVGGWLQSAGMRFAPGGNALLAYIFGCMLVLVSIFVLGMFVRTGIKRFWDNIVAGVMSRIPLAGSVYSAATQIVGLLEKKDGSELQGMSVVYCSFGKENGTGILALLPSATRYPMNGRDHFIVYIPTSPVPMTGGLLFCPVDSVQVVDMSVESLMSIYLSMGVTGPDLTEDKLAGATP